ncbi:tRNA epoxyqueuosine(34) reductase QueG [Halorhodospira halophila]|uniref:Epoxyqueuosine reductase n=1 Tax=Halorhodospira halophila (strain DSM 244 / SL1) TaxID=349124 RepID=A1WUU2_HALHL|nr:tRNA epoxyqueuosine(34) reductase QueG [Halorhodospira halophila]ABM61454.1 putative iron-sulfur cluster binding protein [Halorhodospira halophila SL1]MBK1728701.1 tRNA epoxyqueuosine(34) reductase QueG [Halorhodospira halophila]
MDPSDLTPSIRTWAAELGFSACGIASTELPGDEAHLIRWLQAGHQGAMGFMGRHGRKRARPRQLVPGTRSVVVVRMDYTPDQAADPRAVLDDPQRAFITRYSLGRDYHKLVRRRLQKLAERIQAAIGPFGYRAFVDSAPVLERALARDAGLGWIGKNTMLLNRHAGSYFFLGELFTDLPLPTDTPVRTHCGSCRRCLHACPTDAFVGPYQLDARRCISYLTIEHPGPIPEALRPAMGNRIFGCDDCQLVCPWNRYAHPTAEADFQPRHGLDDAALVALFGWDEATYLERTAGSAIRRIGHERWLRNLAVALGNAASTREVVAALGERLDHPSALVREHVRWALARHGAAPERTGD